MLLVFASLTFFSCYTPQLAYNPDTQTLSSNQFTQRYARVIHSARPNRIVRNDKHTPRFTYRYDSHTGDVYVKSIVCTSLSDGVVTPMLKVRTSSYEIPVTAELLSSEILTIFTEDYYYNTYFTVNEFVLTRKMMDEIRQTKYLGYILQTQNKEQLRIEPGIMQLLDIKRIGLPY